MDDQDEPLLDVVGLAKTYGRRKVVDGVDLYVDRQEIVGLLGPNGAGKTTSFRMTCGMIEPDRGRVFSNGVDVTNWPMFNAAATATWAIWPRSPASSASSASRRICWRHGIARHGSQDAPPPLRRAARSVRHHASCENRKRRSSSGGERRRLEIARCLVSDPEIILLDEPFTGIDPVTMHSIQAIIRRSARRRHLDPDHRPAVREILEVTDRSYVIHEGTVLFDGPPEEVRSHPEVKRIYLGDLDAGESGVPPPHLRSSNPRPDDLAPAACSSESREDSDEDGE